MNYQDLKIRRFHIKCQSSGVLWQSLHLATFQVASSLELPWYGGAWRGRVWRGGGGAWRGGVGWGWGVAWGHGMGGVVGRGGVGCSGKPDCPVCVSVASERLARGPRC